MLDDFFQNLFWCYSCFLVTFRLFKKQFKSKHLVKIIIFSAFHLYVYIWLWSIAMQYHHYHTKIFHGSWICFDIWNNIGRTAMAWRSISIFRYLHTILKNLIHIQGADKVLDPPIIQNMAYFWSFYANGMTKSHIGWV